MFIVPKWWVDESGKLTKQRNGAMVTAIEHKMGIKGSATATLNFGEEGKCIGELLGEGDVNLCVPHARTARIQEVHLLAIHCLCDAIDHTLLGDES